MQIIDNMCFPESNRFYLYLFILSIIIQLEIYHSRYITQMKMSTHS